MPCYGVRACIVDEMVGVTEKNNQKIQDEKVDGEKEVVKLVVGTFNKRKFGIYMLH